jgi:hypothetical protein
MAHRTAQDPEQLVEVVWAATGQKVTLPRRLVNTGNRASQMRHLVATGQLPDPEATPLPSMDTPAEIVQATVDAAALTTLEARLRRLEQQPAPILPSEASLAQWAMAAQRIGTSHQELAATQEQTITAVEATAQAADERLGELDARQAALIEQVSEAVSEGQEAVAAAVVNLEQQAAGALSDIEEQALATAAEIARQQRGPEGLPGSGVTVAMEDPTTTDPSSWAKRWFGRDALVAGDGALVPTPTALRVFRYTGSSWLEGPAIEPKVEMVNAQISALDASTKTYPTVASAATGSSGGGLMDPLIAGLVTKGGATVVADSSRWQANPYWDSFTSGLLLLEIVPTAGTFGGKHHFMSVGFTLLAGAPDSFRFTEFSSLGAGFSGPNPGITVSIDGSMAAPTAPGGLGISIAPTAKPATRLFVTVNSTDPAATSFVLKGSVVWTQPASTGTQQANLPSPSQPGWLLV